LKPADYYNDDDVLYLMEDMATGEIRMSICWEWVHKGTVLTEYDPERGISAGADSHAGYCGGWGIKPKLVEKVIEIL
jgi:hypothetical protein